MNDFVLCRWSPLSCVLGRNGASYFKSKGFVLGPFAWHILFSYLAQVGWPITYSNQCPWLLSTYPSPWPIFLNLLLLSLPMHHLELILLLLPPSSLPSFSYLPFPLHQVDENLCHSSCPETWSSQHHCRLRWPSYLLHYTAVSMIFQRINTSLSYLST